MRTNNYIKYRKSSYNLIDIDSDDYDEDENALKKGYWGYMRDQRADRLNKSRPSSYSMSNLNKNFNAKNKNHKQSQHKNEDAYYWGSFKDQHLDLNENKEDLNTANSTTSAKSSVENLKMINSNEYLFNSEPSSANASYKENNNSNTSNNNNKKTKKIVYDYMRSKFKIEAQKRDE